MSVKELMIASFAITLGIVYPSRNAGMQGKIWTRMVVEEVMGKYLSGAVLTKPFRSVDC